MPWYKKDKISHSLVHKKVRQPYITTETDKAKVIDQRLIKVNTNKSNPDYYDLDPAFKKTARSNPKFTMSKDKLVNFTDNYKKGKKFVPGVGHHKVETTVFDKISKTPLSMKRH